MSPPSPSFSTVHGAWAFLFLVTAYVQLNDPDPGVWVSLYLILALFHCIKSVLNPPSFSSNNVVLAFSALPAILLLHSIHLLLQTPSNYELMREIGGLFLALLSLQGPHPLFLGIFCFSFALYMGVVGTCTT
jgi:hypothetical protein